MPHPISPPFTTDFVLQKKPAFLMRQLLLGWCLTAYKHVTPHQRHLCLLLCATDKAKLFITGPSHSWVPQWQQMMCSCQLEGSCTLNSESTVGSSDSAVALTTTVQLSLTADTNAISAKDIASASNPPFRSIATLQKELRSFHHLRFESVSRSMILPCTHGMRVVQ